MSEIQSEKFSFRWNPLVQKIVNEWYNELTPGEMALMRRCKSPNEVALTPPFHSLKIQLSSFIPDLDRLAAVVGLISHLKKRDIKLNIGAQMASGGDGHALVSEIRLRKLIEIEDMSKLFRTMIRLIRILSGEMNWTSMADSVYWWGPKTKKQIVSDYYEHYQG